MTVNKQIMKSYRFKIMPNNEQKELLSQWFGCRRFVYNKFAEIQKKRKENGEGYLHYTELDKFLSPWKKNEFPFLKDVNSQALQQVSKDSSRAVNTFFQRLEKGKGTNTFNFKKKYDSKQSISFPVYNNNTRFIHNYKVYKKAKVCYIQIPKMKDYLKVLKHRNFEGEIKNVTLSKEGDCYYISLQTKQSIVIDSNDKPISTIGIDLGVKKLVTTSNGEVFRPLNAFKKNQNKLARLQRKLSRCTKKSNNFIRLKKRINKLHKKIVQMRKDYLHKLSTYLVNNHAIIYIEDLKINNMSKSAKGTIEKPGKNVKQKSGLNRSILEQGWGIFSGMLKYKQDWKDQTLEKRQAAFSSQECCLCHSKRKSNRASQAKFACSNCDNKINADLNAALNILYRGLVKSGLTKEEAQEIVGSKIIKRLKYTNLWIQEGKASVRGLSSGCKVASAA
ncbi:MAG: transposase [Chloroflexi bacterium]|nr:transposase [Chloroflexota bacterium]